MYQTPKEHFELYLRFDNQYHVFYNKKTFKYKIDFFFKKKKKLEEEEERKCIYIEA